MEQIEPPQIHQKFPIHLKFYSKLFHYFSLKLLEPIEPTQIHQIHRIHQDINFIFLFIFIHAIKNSLLLFAHQNQNPF